jgi:ABC-type lipoprotein export system ATPase subunit
MTTELTIIAGVNRNGVKENFTKFNLVSGETISIVGPTGSGKTAFISDIELLAQEDTATHRKILLNGKVPSDVIRFNPATKPIAMITQNTKCFADVPVGEFLTIHARSRGIEDRTVIGATIELANLFTGEKIQQNHKVTTLSGGQTRSLLIADAILIGAAPVILLDEIENAGIFKQEVIEVIRDTGKMIVFVTHDPVIALHTNKRLIMENGGVKKVIVQTETERFAAKNLVEIDKRMRTIREELRAGNLITTELARVNFV